MRCFEVFSGACKWTKRKMSNWQSQMWKIVCWRNEGLCWQIFNSFDIKQTLLWKERPLIGLGLSCFFNSQHLWIIIKKRKRKWIWKNIDGLCICCFAEVSVLSLVCIQFRRLNGALGRNKMQGGLIKTTIVNRGN